MADAPVVHIGENSPEQIAFKLMMNIAFCEKMGFQSQNGVPLITGGADRKWLLDTYAECLEATKGYRVRSKLPRTGGDDRLSAYRGPEDDD